MGAAPSSGQGTALQFDGIDDEVFVPADASLHPTQMTLEAWVYVEAYNAAGGVGMIVNAATSAGLSACPCDSSERFKVTCNREHSGLIAERAAGACGETARHEEQLPRRFVQGWAVHQTAVLYGHC